MTHCEQNGGWPIQAYFWLEWGISTAWISPDPAGLAAVNPTNPQSWNRYAYVNNSPLNSVDPLGLQLCHHPCNPGDPLDGFNAGSNNPLDPTGGDSFWAAALGGMSFNVIEYNFSAAWDFPWASFSPSDLLSLAGTETLNLDSVTSLGITGDFFGSLLTNGGQGGGSPAGKLKPWDIRPDLVALLRSKNDCSKWFSTGQGSAPDIISNVAIINYAPPDPNIPGADAQTTTNIYNPIEVFTNGRFWSDSVNGLPVGGVFDPGSYGAQMIILLHELAHKMGSLIPTDGLSVQQSEQNTQTVMTNCGGTVK